jgi:hypothetical protein
MEKERSFIYKTEIKGHTMAHSMKSDFNITVKNEVIYKGYNNEKDLHRFIIRELEYTLDSYEDPIVMQIIEMTNRVCSIYKELDLGINKHGEIKEFFNLNDVKKKWQLVKEWLTNAHPLESYEVIRAKELELSHVDFELKNLKFIHFLHQYFFIFGRKPEEGNTSYIRKNEMDRFGGGIIIPVTLNLSQERKENLMVRRFEGKMIRDESVVQRLREFSKDKFMHPEYEMKGKYTYDNTEDLLVESDFTITEKLGEYYYTHSYLHLKLEENV